MKLQSKFLIWLPIQLITHWLLFYRLKDVVAGYSRGKGKHGEKETSETNYKKHLEKNFATIHGLTTPKWAKLDKPAKRVKKDSDDESDDENNLAKVGPRKVFSSPMILTVLLLFQTAGNFMKKGNTFLSKNVLKIKRVKDINKSTRAEGALIKSIEFHKKQSIAMVAGNAGVVSLFQVWTCLFWWILKILNKFTDLNE